MPSKVFSKPNVAPATQQEMNRFVRVVDDFMKKRAELVNQWDTVYQSNDPELKRQYSAVMDRADSLKSVIETTTGLWYDFKTAYAKVTDVTSTHIGDWIDEFRSWFGYDPAGGLGAAQVPAAVLGAAWVAGIIAAATLAIKAMNEVLALIQASKIQRETGMPYDQALVIAKDAYSGSFFKDAALPALIIGGIALYMLLGQKRNG